MLERKHRNPKRWAFDAKNVRSQWGASVLREVTNQHLAELTLPDKWLFDSNHRLLNPTVPKARMLSALEALFGNLDFLVASGANVNGHENCWKSDVVRGKICSASDDHAMFTSMC